MVVLAGLGEATQEGSHAKFSFLFIQRHPEAFRGLRLVARVGGGVCAGGSPQGATSVPSDPHLVAGTDGPSRGSQEGEG